jgi:site-specific DNA-methyltransferase (adenine-specific)
MMIALIEVSIMSRIKLAINMASQGKSKKQLSISSPPYPSAESLLAFASAHAGKILPASLVREMADVGSPQTHDLFRQNGMKLLTHRECPGLLHAEQMLFWPQDAALPPDAKKTAPQAPVYNPTDGRRYTPKKNLSASELTNTLFEGDCLSILPYFPAQSIDMILCDLPYGTTQNKWDSLIPLEPLWEQYRRILKPAGVVVLTSQGIFTAKLILSNESWFKYKIVWEKSKPTNFLNAKKQPLRKHEDICVFYAKQPVYNPQMTQGAPYDKGIRKNQLSGSYGDFLPARVRSSGERYPTDVVYFKTAESEGEVWHPTQKPVELGRYLVRTFTDPGALVLDNAFGSGSFLVAAAMEGRRYVGIERNQDVHLFKRIQIDYVGVARERLEKVSQPMASKEKEA